jgi:hypothetical protein
MFGFFKRMLGRGEADAAAASRRDRASGPVIAMVTLPKVLPLNAKAVANALRRNYGVEAGEITSGEGEAASTIGVGEGYVALGMMPGPIPWSDLEGPCVTAWHWPEATDVMRPHRAHVIVAAMGHEALDPVERSLLATRAAAAVAETHGATGLYWGNGTVVNPADRLIEMTREASADDPPVLLWVEARYGREDDGSGLAFTTGMESLGHKEFEIRRTHRPPEEVVEMLLDLCLYVLKRGPILLHGQTFGRTAEERMKIRHGPSMHSGRGKVITLEM